MVRLPPVSSNQHLSEKIHLKLDAELLDALRRLAELGDRTVAAEIRRALREHVKGAEQEAASA